ncbi:RNA methyltransferase [Microcoleus sp. FACHB-68]|uniref:RNA methyltransferase n=1 Tax=Microcoleus sp. FACHB-68 TaxID=2692826 RepID=UPI001685F994|nr:RNA methyltransferase [Microcoleus sp. FACHB-68]MBD1938800.1 RNA methyltransferase [Microcoleus sp. FACHB-68]
MQLDSSILLSRIRIVLVEPAGPLNVGAIARVMKNMGLQQLVLVNPQCDPLGEDARKMAVHAADILESSRLVTSLPAALQGCQRAIATTSRDRSIAPPVMEHPRSGLPWLLETPAALIFGPEYRGLSNEELKYAQRFVRIPSTDIYPSLNLAQAVAICCYELSESARWEEKRQQGFEETQTQNSNITQPSFSLNPTSAPLEALEGYYEQLEALLLKIEYLYPHTAASRMEKFRCLFNRAQPSGSEVSMLRGILRQVEWALSNQRMVDDTLKASHSAQAQTLPDCSADKLSDSPKNPLNFGKAGPKDRSEA